MSDYLKEIHEDVRELRRDFKEILKQMPEFATKDEVRSIEKDVNSFKTATKVISSIAAGIWAIITFLFPFVKGIMPH